MSQSRAREQPLGELLDCVLPAEEHERLARVDALLRVAAARDRDDAIATSGDGGDCERMRGLISAALDGEVSKLESTRMREHVDQFQSCARFEDDRERLAGTLRAAPPAPLHRSLQDPSNRTFAQRSRERDESGDGVRPSSRTLPTPEAVPGSRRHRVDEETYALRLTFGELALVYKSLQAVKTLGALPPQDELLNDTIQLVDQALHRAV